MNPFLSNTEEENPFLIKENPFLKNIKQPQPVSQEELYRGMPPYGTPLTYDPFAARHPYLAAIPATAWELGTSQIPFGKYLTKEGREELRGKFFPVGSTTDPEELRKIEENLRSGRERISPYESLSKESMGALEFAAFPTALRTTGAIAESILPKAVVRLAKTPIKIPSIRGRGKLTLEPEEPTIEPSKPIDLKTEVKPVISGIEAETNPFLAKPEPPNIKIPKTPREIELDEKIALQEKKIEALKPKPELGLESTEAMVKGGSTKTREAGTLPKYAGGEKVSAINLDRIEGTNDLLNFIDNTAKGLEKRIGKTKNTVDEIWQEAEKWGMTPKESINMAKGLENFSNQVANIRQIHRNLAEETFNQIRSLPADISERTPELLGKVKAKLDQYSEIAVAASRTASQWGKAGAVLRKGAEYKPEWGYQSLLDRATKLMQNPKNAKRFNDIVSRLQELNPDNAEGFSKFLYGLQKTKWQKLSDGAYELWINGLVSFSPSHVANTVSNTLTLTESKAEGLIGSGVDILRSKITGTPRERFAGEIKQELFATSKGLQDGLKQFYQAWKTGKTDISKFEKFQSALPEGVRKFMPTTALMAEDEFFKGIIKSTELNRLAYRMAKQQGLKGDTLKSKITELLNNPTEQMLEQVAQKAKYLTYQKELGPIGNWILRGRSTVPGLKYFIPFVRTPANIGKFALERTPLNIPRIVYLAGKKELTGGELSDEIAKALTGTLMGVGTYLLATEGLVTGGGPKNKFEREEKMRTGWQPYSFHIGDKYYPFGRFEPMGSILGLAADFYEIQEQVEKDDKFNISAGIAGAINNNISNKTFMQGFSNVSDFISDPGKYGERTIQNVLGSAIPNISAGTARATDEYIRETRSLLDKYISRIPEVSKILPYKLDIWGDPIKRPGTAVTRFLLPGQISREKGEPIDKELEKLKLNLGYPPKKIKDVELTTEEWQQQITDFGQPAKKELNRLVTHPRWNELDDELKEKKIKSISNFYRDRARNNIIRKLKSEGRLK